MVMTSDESAPGPAPTKSLSSVNQRANAIPVTQDLSPLSPVSSVGGPRQIRTTARDDARGQRPLHAADLPASPSGAPPAQRRTRLADTRNLAIAASPWDNTHAASPTASLAGDLNRPINECHFGTPPRRQNDETKPFRSEA
jgi:hypothetical protein